MSRLSKQVDDDKQRWRMKLILGVLLGRMDRQRRLSASVAVLGRDRQAFEGWRRWRGSTARVSIEEARHLLP